MNKLIPIHPQILLNDIENDFLNNIKVTFINMPLREAALPNVPPEGPAILSSIIRKYGGTPSIIDLNAYRIKDDTAKKKPLDKVRRERTHLQGMSKRTMPTVKRKRRITEEIVASFTLQHRPSGLPEVVT